MQRRRSDELQTVSGDVNLPQGAGQPQFPAQGVHGVGRRQPGWNEMVHLAADAAASNTFDEKTLRLSLAEIARRSFGDGATVNQALEEGWKQGVSHVMADGIVTQSEEARLREFRDRLALDAGAADQKAKPQAFNPACFNPNR